MTNLLTRLRALLRPEAQRKEKPVVLTPLSFDDGNSQVVGIFIRDPDTEEIVDEAVTSGTLAEKTGMSREKACRIFQEAYAALERRMGSAQEQGSKGAEEQD